MSIKRSLIKNTGFNLAGYVYLLFASFFSISILLRNLGSNIFGIYLFLGSFVSLASVFDFGISTAIVRKFAIPETSKEERIKIWKTSFALYLLLAFILFVAVMAIMLNLVRSMPLFYNLDKNILNLSVVFLSITVFINHINSHFLNLPQAEQRFDVFNSKTLLVGTANTVLSALLSGFFPNIAAIFAMQLIFHIFTALYMIWYSIKLFPGKEFLPSYDKETGKDLLSYGIKNFIGILANQMESQISKFALGAAATATAITSFSIPQNIVAKGAGVVSQFAQAFFPLSASLLAKERIEKLKKLVLAVEGLTFLGGLLAIFLSFTIGESFLTWWLHNPEVVRLALPILKIFSFYFLLVALTPVPTALVQSLNKPQIPSFFSCLTVVLEIILMIFLVPRYQALGAAYAFLGSVCISVPVFLIVSWILLRREIARVTA